jgi:hypothetical protein
MKRARVSVFAYLRLSHSAAHESVSQPCECACRNYCTQSLQSTLSERQTQCARVYVLKCTHMSATVCLLHGRCALRHYCINARRCARAPSDFEK